MKRNSIVMRGVLLVATLALTGCPFFEDDTPEPVDYGLVLEAVDVVCTEAVFKVARNKAQGEREDIISIGLFRGDSLVVTDSLLETSYLRDEGLEPNTAYSYSLAVVDASGEKVRQMTGDSSFVSITTMDTTSHDFEWEIITLGDYGSYFNDVAIVDENNIWAVGYIKMGDSIYNAAHWNGSEWEMIEIYDGHVPLYGIWYFDDNNIWVTNGCSVFHLEDNEWIYYRFSSGGVGVNCCAGKAIWASSPEDIWFAGNKGSLVHYDGESFERVESGTEIDLLDIDGTDDGSHIFVAGVTRMGELGGQSVFIHIDHFTPEIMYSSSNYTGNISEGNYGSIYSLTVANQRVYSNTGGVDLLVYDIVPESFHYLPKRSTVLSGEHYSAGYQICGNKPNNLFFFSSETEAIHYNGKDFRMMTELNDVFDGNTLWVRGARNIDNMIVLVGIYSTDMRGIITKGVLQ